MIIVSIIHKIIIITGKAETLCPVCIIHGLKIYIIIDLGVIFHFIDHAFLLYHNLESFLGKKPYWETFVLADGRT